MERQYNGTLFTECSSRSLHPVAVVAVFNTGLVMVDRRTAPVFFVQHDIVSAFVAGYASIAGGGRVVASNAVGGFQAGCRPANVVGSRPGFGMARRARILFVANHARIAIPRGHYAMCAGSEQIVVRNRLHHIMAVLTGILRMANAARGILHHAELSVALLPGHVMA